MSKQLSVNTGAVRLNRIFLASLVASGAFTFVGTGHAQEQAYPTAAPGPLVTAPSTRPSLMQLAPENSARGVPGQLGATGAAPAVPVAPTSVGQPEADSVPWVLETDQHPWPLRYQELNSLPRLYVNLPSEQEARIMLPGRSADEADRIRGVVEKFVTNSIGTAAQDRGRQLEALNEWVARSATQQRTLSADPWQAYQFSKESLQQIIVFRKGVEPQSDASIQTMVADVQAAVAKVSPLMAAMPSYELQMAWYNVLKQLKEGVSLYNAQVTSADAKLLQAIDQYLTANPPVARPEGRKPEPYVSGVKRSADAAPQPGLSAPADLRTPAKPAPQEDAKKDSSDGGWMAMVVIAGMAAAVVGLFMKLRRKVKGDKVAASTQD